MYHMGTVTFNLRFGKLSLLTVYAFRTGMHMRGKAAMQPLRRHLADGKYCQQHPGHNGVERLSPV